MASAAEIVFLGLCTFLNVDHYNTRGLPAPAVALVRVDVNHATHGGAPIPRHVAFIAYDSNSVELTGVPDQALPDTPYRFVVLDGEELSFTGAPAGKTRVKPSFATVPRQSQYWKTQLATRWNRCVAPLKGAKASSNCVAAYMPLGGGDLSAGHLTPIEWEFRETSEDAAILRDRFAREVYYRFPLSTATIVLTTTTLDAKHQTRTMTFTAKNRADKTVRLWIGNTPDTHITGEILGLEPIEYTSGSHFAALKRVVAEASEAIDAIYPTPFPTMLRAPGVVARGGSAGDKRSPDGGYCGPAGTP